MESEKLLELIKQFAKKGHITESEKKILLLKAKSFGISDRTVDILIRQGLESKSSNVTESSKLDYLGYDKRESASSTDSNKAVTYGIIGFLVGIPVSYFFQPEKVRAVYSLPQYLAKLPEMLGAKNSGDFFTPVIISCLIAAVIGAFIGNSLDKK